MGRTHVFECPKCGHRAKVAGGADRGFRFAVQTVLCSDCKVLLDAVTELRITATPPLAETLARKRLKPLADARRGRSPTRPPTFAAALNRLLPAGAEHFKWLRFKPACPVSPLHRVREWNRPDRCPKCGVLMEQTALPFRIWD
jgi:hypothetical protein